MLVHHFCLLVLALISQSVGQVHQFWSSHQERYTGNEGTSRTTRYHRTQQVDFHININNIQMRDDNNDRLFYLYQQGFRAQWTTPTPTVPAWVTPFTPFTPFTLITPTYKYGPPFMTSFGPTRQTQCHGLQYRPCVFLRECPQIYDLLRGSNDISHVLTILEDYWCGVEMGRTKVCCSTDDKKLACLRLPEFTCTEVEQCPIIQSQLYIDQQQIKSSWSCGTDRKGQLQVCCKKEDVQKVTEIEEEEGEEGEEGEEEELPKPDFTDLDMETAESGLTFDHHNTDLKYYRCGKQPDHPTVGARLSGGVDSSINEFPWVLRLLFSYDNGTASNSMCTGSLISTMYVLTAAHCVSNRTKNDTVIEVKLGAAISQGEHVTTSVKFPVADVIVHPEYDGNYNDIALLKLGRTVTDNVTHICLPRKEEEEEKYSKHKEFTVAGWGITRTGGNPSDTLQTAEIKYVDNNHCERQSSQKLQSTQMCAGATIKVAICDGDSGGPLMATTNMLNSPNKEISRFTIEGVTSKSNECHRKGRKGQGRPVIFTRVDQYLPWITKYIGQPT